MLWPALREAVESHPLALEMDRFLPLRHRRLLARDDYAGVRRAAVTAVRQALAAAEAA